jgi:hypothetical protein
MRCAWRRGSCWRPHWWPRNRPGVEGQGRGGRRRGGSFSAPLATTFGGAHSPCPPTLSPVNEVSGPANGSLRPTHPITDRGVVRRALLLGSGLRPATGWVVLRSSRDHVQGGARTSPSKVAAGARGLWPREWVAAPDPPHHRPGAATGSNRGAVATCRLLPSPQPSPRGTGGKMLVVAGVDEWERQRCADGDGGGSGGATHSRWERCSRRSRRVDGAAVNAARPLPREERRTIHPRRRPDPEHETRRLRAARTPGLDAGSSPA